MKTSINKYFSSINTNMNRNIRINFNKTKYNLSIKGEMITNKELYSIINNKNLLFMQMNENIKRNVNVKSQEKYYMSSDDFENLYNDEKLSRSSSINKVYDFDLIRNNEYIPINEKKYDDINSEIRIIDYNFNIESLKQKNIDLKSLEYTPEYSELIDGLNNKSATNLKSKSNFFPSNNTNKGVKLSKNFCNVLEQIKLNVHTENTLPFILSAALKKEFPELIFSKDKSDFTKINRKNVNNLYNLRLNNNTANSTNFLPIIIENESNDNSKNQVLKSFTTLKKLCQYHNLNQLHGVITNLVTWRFIMYVNSKDSIENEDNFHISNKIIFKQGLTNSKLDIINNTLELLL